MAVTTISATIIVAPTMPHAVLHKRILALFPDSPLPALTLGVPCGGDVPASILALWRPHRGAAAAVVAGVFMIAFELVEIVVVDFNLAQTP